MRWSVRAVPVVILIAILAILWLRRDIRVVADELHEGRDGLPNPLLLVRQQEVAERPRLRIADPRDVVELLLPHAQEGGQRQMAVVLHGAPNDRQAHS